MWIEDTNPLLAEDLVMGLLRSQQQAMEDAGWQFPFSLKPYHTKFQGRRTGKFLVKMPTLFHARMYVALFNRYEWESEDFQVRYLRCSMESEDTPAPIRDGAIPAPSVPARAATNELINARALRTDTPASSSNTQAS